MRYNQSIVAMLTLQVKPYIASTIGTIFRLLLVIFNYLFIIKTW